MEIIRFYKQKRILHKYVNWLYDLTIDGRFYELPTYRNYKSSEANQRRLGYSPDIFPEKYTREMYNSGIKIKQFEHMYHCADTHKVLLDVNTGEHMTKHGYFCGSRICPVCTIKKSLWEYSKQTWLMEQYEGQFDYFMLTLTLPNNFDGFREELDLIAEASRILVPMLGFGNSGHDRNLAAGCFGSFEVTNIGNGWHPHLHLIIAYPVDYVRGVTTKTVKKGKKERTFINELVIEEDPKFTKKGELSKHWKSLGSTDKGLTTDEVRRMYIDTIKSLTDKYNDRLSDLDFLDIGWEPCYNIEQGINELTKYMIDFEALQSADDLFVYMKEIYGFQQRIRRGVFRWTKENKAKHREFLDKLHKQREQEFLFYTIDDGEGNVEIKQRDLVEASLRWYKGKFYSSYFFVEEFRKKDGQLIRATKQRTVGYDYFEDENGKPGMISVWYAPKRVYNLDELVDEHFGYDPDFKQIDYIQIKME